LIVFVYLVFPPAYEEGDLIPVRSQEYSENMNGFW